MCIWLVLHGNEARQTSPAKLALCLSKVLAVLLIFMQHLKSGFSVKSRKLKIISPQESVEVCGCYLPL